MQNKFKISSYLTLLNSYYFWLSLRALIKHKIRIKAYQKIGRLQQNIQTFE